MVHSEIPITDGQSKLLVRRSAGYPVLGERVVQGYEQANAIQLGPAKEAWQVFGWEASVGVAVGLRDGLTVGLPVGFSVGSSVGNRVGSGVGNRVGSGVGRPVGAVDGSDAVGEAEGRWLGVKVGESLGALDGNDVIGDREGDMDGASDGEFDGDDVGVPWDGSSVGVDVGAAVGLQVLQNAGHNTDSPNSPQISTTPRLTAMP